MSDDNNLATQQSPEVRAALDRLYPLFRAPSAGRRVNKWIDGMHSAAECAALEAAGSRTPVAELTGAEFKHLAWHAMCWDGKHPDTLTYFLPRVFDGHFSVGTTAVPTDFFLSNLRMAGWPSGWTDEQRDGVAGLLSAVWPAALAFDPWDNRCPRPADEVLWMTAVLRFDVGPLLDGWRRTRTVPAIGQLAQFLRATIGFLVPPFTSWWDDRWTREPLEPGVQQQVAGWLLSSETAEQLEAGFFAARDQRTQFLLSDARDLLPL